MRTVSAGTLTFTGAGQTLIAGNAIDNAGFTLALAKTGAGALVLSGTNTYSGATTVNGGILTVNGSIASSSMTVVNASGTLGGIGTILAVLGVGVFLFVVAAPLFRPARVTALMDYLAGRFAGPLWPGDTGGKR